MTVGERIKYFREAAGMTMEQLASKIGVQNSAINKYEKGIVTNIPLPRITQIAEALQVEPAVLIGWDDGDDDPEISIPIVAEIAAGFDKFPIDELEYAQRFSVPVSYTKGYDRADLFIVKVRGDSMYPMYQQGDLVLAVRAPSVDNGEVAIVQYEDFATIKLVDRSANGLRLVPINPMYKPEVICDSDIVRVIGKPLVLIRDLCSLSEDF